MKLWHRFLLQPLLATFCFCLCSVLFLYILIDLSVHGVNFSKEWTGISSLLFYYLKHLSIYFDLFTTLSFLLACLKVLSDVTSHLEWCALQMGGLSTKKLLLPFFTFGIVLASISLINGQWIAPSAGKIASGIFEAKKKSPSLHKLFLEDGSELVYAKHHEDLLLDLFWIGSPHEIWHLASFSPSTKVGKEIDILELRDGVHSKDFFQERICPEIQIPHDWKEYQELSLDSLSISALFQETTAEGKTCFHRKLAEPLLPLLAFLAVAPPLLRFQRKQRLFLITTLSLLGFFVQFTLFEGLQILGENRVIAPSLAIWIPLIAAFGFFGWRFRQSGAA